MELNFRMRRLCRHFGSRIKRSRTGNFWSRQRNLKRRKCRRRSLRSTSIRLVTELLLVDVHFADVLPKKEDDVREPRRCKGASDTPGTWESELPETDGRLSTGIEYIILSEDLLKEQGSVGRLTTIRAEIRSVILIDGVHWISIRVRGISLNGHHVRYETGTWLGGKYLNSWRHSLELPFAYSTMGDRGPREKMMVRNLLFYVGGD